MAFKRRFRAFKRSSFRSRNSRRRFGRKLAPKRTGGFYSVRRNAIQAEKKFVDTNLGSTGIGSAGTFFLVNGISAGTAYNERIGRKIRIKSIQMNLGILSGVTNPARIRILVFIDRQANSQLLTIPANLIDNSVITQLSKAFLNLDNRSRFNVLYDKLVTIDSVMRTTMDIKMYRKKVFDVVYSGVGNTSGSIQTNALWVLFVGDLATATNGPTVAGGFRVRYTDA